MTYGVIIIGGGIVGLSAAYSIIQRNPKSSLLIIEKEEKIAQHQTGHNSGVIHSGLYYKPGSMKATNCINGYRMLIDFCRKEDVAFDICGKLVVATEDAELPRLEQLYWRGKENGLEGLKFLNPSELRDIEPHCNGIKGLHVPQTGIINYSLVAQKLEHILLAHGVDIILGQEVVDISTDKNEICINSKNSTWKSRVLVVCAGLQSDYLAEKTVSKLPLRILPFRGEYYKLRPEARSLVRGLIYPVPDPSLPFLGVHFTKMISGDVECGPNAVFAFGREAYKKTDFNLRDTWRSFTWPGFYRVSAKYWKTELSEYYRSLSKRAFVRALQKLIPEIESEHLECGGAGVRAQACDRDGNLLDDFCIMDNKGIIHVCNAPSPAATSSLAIGRTIADRILPMLS